MKFSVLLATILLLSGCQFNRQAISSRFEILYPLGQTKANAVPYQVNIQQYDQTLVLDIHNPGIGTIILKRKQKAWPDKLLIRLYVGGLEGISISQGNKTWKGQDLSIQAYDINGEKYPQLQRPRHLLVEMKGYFQIDLSATELDPNNPEIKIHWVNFYLR